MGTFKLLHLRSVASAAVQGDSLEILHSTDYNCETRAANKLGYRGYHACLKFQLPNNSDAVP